MRYLCVLALMLAPAFASAQQPDSLLLYISEYDNYPMIGAAFGARFDSDEPTPTEPATPIFLGLACGPIDIPGLDVRGPGLDVRGDVVFVFDGECSYVTKVKHISATGAAAVIVFGSYRGPSDDPNRLVYMEGNCTVEDGCTSPAAYLSSSSHAQFGEACEFCDVFVVPVRVSTTTTDDAVHDEDLALAPIAPNPATHSATVAYRLPELPRVRLTVHDLLGREVTQVTSGVHPAGSHSASLSTQDWPSGVYVVRLSGGEAVATQRFTVVR